MRMVVIFLSLALLYAAIVNDAAAAGLGVYGAVPGQGGLVAGGYYEL